MYVYAQTITNIAPPNLGGSKWEQWLAEHNLKNWYLEYEEDPNSNHRFSPKLKVFNVVLVFTDINEALLFKLSWNNECLL